MLWNLILRPILFRFDAERVHHVAMTMFSVLMAIWPVRWLTRAMYARRDARLRTQFLGMELPSPIGLAAGFDKDARWFNDLAELGFGHIEVGTLTGQAQPGNPQPRLFRLPQDRAIINRFGFNNRGSLAAAESLAKTTIRPVLGVNIGKSKVVPNEEANADYLASLDRLWPYARYIAVNVSSPNTQGLRDLQASGALKSLLGALAARNTAIAQERGEPRRPLLVKIAPDLDSDGIDDVIATVREVGLDGIIATNTTIAREPLTTDRAVVDAIGAGGLSGAPLTLRSRAFVAELYRRSGGSIPIIGVGGVMNGEDAWEMMRAGASLVQVYSGFIYAGPAMVADIHRELLRRMQARGLSDLATIVGEAARTPSRP